MKAARTITAGTFLYEEREKLALRIVALSSNQQLQKPWRLKAMETLPQ
jgi:uncharacterized protein YciW